MKRYTQEGEAGGGTHVNPWLIHFNVWQNPLQYCKVISLQLIKKNKIKNKNKTTHTHKKIHLRETKTYGHTKTYTQMFGAHIHS